MSLIQIPDGSSHIFVNTKNKKSYYKNGKENEWEIFNKGLNTWEKVPNMDLSLIPLNVYLQSEAANTFNDIEDTTISITNVTVKLDAKSTSDFIVPPITPEDYLTIYELFEKYSKGTPLGFINGESNYSVYYDHTSMKWYLSTTWSTEYLTIYTTDVEVAKKVLDELNTSVLTTI